MMDPQLSKTTTQKTSATYLILPLWILTGIFLCATLEQASSIFLWIACSFLLMALLDPAQQFLRRYMPKSVSAMVLVLGATLIAMLFLYILAHFSAQMIADLELSKKTFVHYYQNVRQTWDGWMQVFTPPKHVSGAHAMPAPAPQGAGGGTGLGSGGPASAPAAPAAAAPAPSGGGESSSSFGTEFASTLARGVGSFVGVMVYVFLVPVLTLFILTERDDWGRTIQKAMHKPELGPEMWHRIVAATRAFFFGNLLLGVVSFPILVGLFFAFGVPSPITLAALASVFNLIPFLGAVLSGLLPAITLLSTGAHFGSVIALYGLCAVFHMILANFVTPKVLGQRLNVNATTSTIALVVLGELCGGVGLLIAIPLVATVKIMFETSELWWMQWIAALMNEKPRPLPDKPPRA